MIWISVIGELLELFSLCLLRVELQKVPEPIRKGRYESCQYYLDKETRVRQYEADTSMLPRSRPKKKRKGIYIALRNDEI